MPEIFSPVAQGFSPAKLLILAPNWLGDVVMALPAVAAVQRAFPHADLAVAARRSVADLFRLVPGVGRVVTLRSDARWWRRAAFKSDAATLAAMSFDAVLVLPNSFASAWLAKRAGIPERWGYASDSRRRLLTRAVPRPNRRGHQAEYYQYLTRALGMPAGPLVPRIEISDAVRRAARDLLVQHGYDGRSPIVVLAPGAAYGKAKQWIPGHVASLIERLSIESRVVCVLVGSREDAATATEIRSALDADASARVIDLTGKTSLELLAGVLASAAVGVSNDSGAMHVAAAVGAPIVAIFGPTNERATAPLPHDGRRAEVITHEVWCRPCMLRECPIDHRCMAGITPERVFAAVLRQVGASD